MKIILCWNILHAPFAFYFLYTHKGWQYLTRSIVLWFYWDFHICILNIHSVVISTTLMSIQASIICPFISLILCMSKYLKLEHKRLLHWSNPRCPRQILIIRHQIPTKWEKKAVLEHGHELCHCIWNFKSRFVFSLALVSYSFVYCI